MADALVLLYQGEMILEVWPFLLLDETLKDDFPY
jgi:hypothetical protein